MTRYLGLAGLLLLAAWSGVALAGDAAEGRRVADRWCSSCHVASDRAGTDAVPTLASIARDPKKGPGWAREWLQSPHPPMPDPNLTRREADDVIAYLESLAR